MFFTTCNSLFLRPSFQGHVIMQKNPPQTNKKIQLPFWKRGKASPPKKKLFFQSLWLQRNLLKIWIINSQESEDKQKEPSVYYVLNIEWFAGQSHNLGGGSLLHDIWMPGLEMLDFIVLLFPTYFIFIVLRSKIPSFSKVECFLLLRW